MSQQQQFQAGQRSLSPQSTNSSSASPPCPVAGDSNSMEKALPQQHQVQVFQLQQMPPSFNELQLKLPFPEGNDIESTRQRLQLYVFFVRIPPVIYLIGKPINMNRVEALKQNLPRYRKEIADFFKWEYYRRGTRGEMVFIHPFDFINQVTATFVVPSMGLLLIPPHTSEEIELYTMWQRRLMKNVEMITPLFSHVSLAQLQVFLKLEGETRDHDNVKKLLALIPRRTADNAKCLHRVRAINPRNIRPGLQPIIDPYKSTFASWEMDYPDSCTLDLKTKSLLQLWLEGHVLESAVEYQYAPKLVGEIYSSLLSESPRKRFRHMASWKILKPERRLRRDVQRKAQDDALRACQSATQTQTQPVSEPVPSPDL